MHTRTADRTYGDVLWYSADNSYRAAYTHDERVWIWKQTARSTIPSIHMPRWASRITLEITEVRVERLNDISEADAKSEGVQPYIFGHGPVSDSAYNAEGGYHNGRGYRDGFEILWDSINGKKHPWDSNPWVWVIAFKTVEKA